MTGQKSFVGELARLRESSPLRVRVLPQIDDHASDGELTRVERPLDRTNRTSAAAYSPTRAHASATATPASLAKAAPIVRAAGAESRAEWGWHRAVAEDQAEAESRDAMASRERWSVRSEAFDAVKEVEEPRSLASEELSERAAALGARSMAVPSGEEPAVQLAGHAPAAAASVVHRAHDSAAHARAAAGENAAHSQSPGKLVNGKPTPREPRSPAAKANQAAPTKAKARPAGEPSTNPSARWTIHQMVGDSPKALGHTHLIDDSALKRLIRAKSASQLREICKKAKLGCPTNAHKNTLAAIVFRHANSDPNDVPVHGWK
eukprot:CAMPEP_0119363968 /NCGR_PEP_ID=MMETSP1334-20130426/10897_1 /TAXON_ID=127549 /ORGANISM="Calcidiscus leptoporus, Strain RCC1130" /LENGTH=319 /DNA_ID=CAMNT_0007379561 /DNA_START=30 /DNA_END=989 /DNA_ORIENTATION=+